MPMLEIKGRPSVVWFWGATGIITSLLGWWSQAWVPQLGTLWQIVAWSLMVTGVLIVGLGIFKALDRRPVLVVDAEGVLDRTSLPVRRIAWPTISEFRLVGTGSAPPQYLAIGLLDPQQFIQKAPFGSPALLESFHRTYGTPCLIALRTLDVQPETLLLHLQAALQANRR